ncbi:MAG: peptide chain release factor N(5)-glutamine methyltransferase [Eubacteriales bacterium]|nr:peptide chain release factor N(5)-glutamine methyltransferase [Eubacteriales bacterium]
MQCNAQALVRQAREALLPIAGEDALFEARELAGAALGCGTGGLYTAPEATQEQQAAFDAMLQRRMRREPLQYILGDWAFMGLPMRVGPEALIPRQDTETLAEAALRLGKERGYTTALDLCCGTGCIGIALAKLGGFQVTATDVSADCVRLTNENALKNGVMLQTRCGDLFDHITGRYDLIVSNPPYLTKQDMADLQPEVCFEPKEALYGGHDGMDLYRRIRAAYQQYLLPGGTLLLEVGAGQAEQVLRLFGGGTAIPDINGIARVVRIEP